MRWRTEPASGFGHPVLIPRALLRFAPQAVSLRRSRALPRFALLRVRRCARLRRRRMLDGASRPRERGLLAAFI